MALGILRDGARVSGVTRSLPGADDDNGATHEVMARTAQPRALEFVAPDLASFEHDDGLALPPLRHRDVDPATDDPEAMHGVVAAHTQIGAAAIGVSGQSMTRHTPRDGYGRLDLDRAVVG